MLAAKEAKAWRRAAEACQVGAWQRGGARAPRDAAATPSSRWLAGSCPRRQARRTARDAVSPAAGPAVSVFPLAVSLAVASSSARSDRARGPRARSRSSGFDRGIEARRGEAAGLVSCGEPEPLVAAALASRGVARRGGQAAGVIKDAGDSSAVMSCCCSAARHGSVFRFVLPPPAGANLFFGNIFF